MNDRTGWTVGWTVVRTAAVGLVVAAAAYGCGDDDGPTDPGETIASVELAPSETTLVSLGETVTLEATARDAGGDAVGASFDWSSDDPGVVEVDDAGAATAVANGSATIRASADGVSGEAVVVVAQEMDSMEVAQGDGQAGAVGMPLDTLIHVRAYDAGGSPAADIALAFAVSNAAAVDDTTATTGADGIATVEWTLGTSPGPYELTVTPAGDTTTLAVVTATGFAEVPAAMALLDGDDQTELPSLPLPQPIRVKLVDEYDNPVVGIPVEFSATGGGTVAPAEALTGLDGVASATWTLGSSLGEQTAQALVRDSVVFDLVDLPGSPVSFTATAVPFALDAVTPDTATVGATLTLEGTGFAPDSSDNEILIDGEAATIVAATQTSITVEVPSFGCAAGRQRTLDLVRGTDSAAVDLTVNPAGALDLAVGERVVVTDPEDYCLQFLPSSDPDSADYLVGLTSTRAWNASASFVVTANDTASPGTVAADREPARSLEAAFAAADATSYDAVSPEAALREWERDFLAPSPRLAGSTATAADGGIEPALTTAAAAPAEGTDVTFRVPNIVNPPGGLADPCNDYVSEAATILHVGPRLVIAVPEVPDIVFSTLSSELDAAVTALNTLFQSTIFDRVTAYIGDLDVAADDDGRVTVLLTPVLNDEPVPPAFATAVDLVDQATCPASDEEAIVYVTIPDIDYNSLSTVVADMTAEMLESRPLLAHELTHVVQTVQRIGNGIAKPLPIWLAEGQAELLVEVVGRALRGDAARMDYGADVVNADALSTRWYLPRFERLSYLFGWDGGSGTVDGAPEQCSVFAFGGIGVPCDPAYASGATWSLARFITDRVAPDLTDGESELHRALTLLPGDGDIDDYLETHTGRELAELIVDWAMMLYADGRLSAAQAPDVQLESWDLADIYGAMPAAQRLTPDAFAFEAFSHAGSVVGGGTAYLRLTDAGTHGAVAVRVRDAVGRPLSPELGARLWVVRLP